MKKNRRNRPRCKGPKVRSPQEVDRRESPSARDLLREGLFGLCFQVGLQEFKAMLEEDREALCGPRYKQEKGRQAYRYGYDKGTLPFGGRLLDVKKPRVRSLDGKEIPLPTWLALAGQDPLGAHIVQQILVGVSTRDYGKSLEPLPVGTPFRTPTKSAISRKFVARTAQEVAKYLSRSLEGLDLFAILVDGLRVWDRMILVAMGIDTKGKKHVLSVTEGTTENEGVCTDLFRDFLGRGLKTEKPILFIVDGGKGIRNAIRSVFGQWAMIQRCQVHKLRNVQDKLPKSKWPSIKSKILEAWSLMDFEEAKRKLKSLAKSLKENYPSAAKSILEGLDETLTLIRLGVDRKSALGRSLMSTNIIENLNGMIRKYTKNVKRWRSGSMIIRWVATALQESEGRFRRIKGYSNIPKLLPALEREVERQRLGNKRNRR